MPQNESYDTQVKEILIALGPEHLILENESHMHAGPATDSHYKVVMVSKDFEGVRTVARHQMIYKALEEELKGPIHALSLNLYTPEEWLENGQVFPESPTCQGKN
ncbi:MAG: BolA family protein [Oceanobacter sp.]